MRAQRSDEKNRLFDFLNFWGLEPLGIDLRQSNINILQGNEPHYVCFKKNYLLIIYFPSSHLVYFGKWIHIKICEFQA